MTPSFSDEDLKRLKDRFWKKVKKTSTCWFWIGAKRHGGYGDAWWNGRHFAAHRLTFSWFKGPIPEGLTIDHLCRFTACVNPEHLQAIPMLDNCRLGSKIQNTHCPNGHEFNAENTYVYQTSRNCRICKRAKDRRYIKLHPEKYRRKSHESYVKAKEKILSRQREYYRNNRKRILERQKVSLAAKGIEK